jgi:hypothetical protein
MGLGVMIGRIIDHHDAAGQLVSTETVGYRLIGSVLRCASCKAKIPAGRGI